jgi:hypothetical protein
VRRSFRGQKDEEHLGETDLPVAKRPLKNFKGLSQVEDQPRFQKGEEGEMPANRRAARDA